VKNVIFFLVILLFVACPLRADGIHMAQLMKEEDFEKDLDLVT